MRKSWPIEVLRRVVRRQVVDDALDRIRLRLDTFPRGLYQPVASLPVRTSTRAAGCESRLKAMIPVLERTRPVTAVDIGANAGYFSIELARRGIATIALEPDPQIQRIAMLAVRRSGVPCVGVLGAGVAPGTMALLPPADCVLFLSLWHHLVREHGMEATTDMLGEIWARTAAVMFFDTGQGEMPAEFGLPSMGPDERAWLADYLAAACPGATIEHVGRHQAFDAHGRPCQRDLFAVIRS